MIPIVKREELLGSYVHKLSRALRNAVSSEVQKRGSPLSDEQGRLLGFMSRCSGEKGFVYQKDIETHFGVRRSSVASILANLERGGFITRESDNEDTRKKRVYMTDKGKAEIAIVHSVICDSESVLVEGMTEDEQKMLISLLSRAISNIENTNNDKKECDC